jgi:hypothetical protein
MSGAARVAGPADVVVGPRRDPAVSVLAVAIPHAAPRAGSSRHGRSAHVTLVMSAHVTPNGVPTTAGEVSGSAGAADAGVC